MLNQTQRDLVSSWIGPWQIIDDLSWGLVDSHVLRAHTADGDVIIKATGPYNNHLAREIDAYTTIGPAMYDAGWIPAYLGGNADHHVLVTEFVPGQLAEKTGADRVNSFVSQAGVALRLLHSLDHGVDETLEKNLTKSALAWLSKPHAIDPAHVDRARQILSDEKPLPVATVACHGDYSGRNWIDHGGRLTVIDFGRFGHRPPSSDLLRMYYRHWRRAPHLKAAFADGYGSLDELTSGRSWKVAFLREAISTAAWAHKVGDAEFEAEGLALIGPALEMFE